MEKTRDLFKKIRDTKGTFHAKMGSIKDRNGMDLTKAEDIKKRWQEYTEELYKKDLHDPDNHYGVITHLVPDILEYKVKWALESITVKAFLSLLAIFETLHSNGYIFPFLLCFLHFFFSQLFVRPPQTTILLFCISFSWGWS